MRRVLDRGVRRPVAEVPLVRRGRVSVAARVRERDRLTRDDRRRRAGEGRARHQVGHGRDVAGLRERVAVAIDVHDR